MGGICSPPLSGLLQSAANILRQLPTNRLERSRIDRRQCRPNLQPRALLDLLNSDLIGGPSHCPLHRLAFLDQRYERRLCLRSREELYIHTYTTFLRLI